MSASASRPSLHVVTHVHWDREWYRPFESYRARLVELVTRVCDQIERGVLESFHLDGQTVTIADVLEIEPTIEDRLRGHIRSGKITVGPWHVLSDNQLVSGENLIRNLLTARRWAPRIGELSSYGYSPDAFGHPADLPRILNGFGIDTALVWRGAPSDLARFRWVSPDGSSIFTVNQAYHEAEVLWTEEGRGSRLGAFLERESARLPEGPWLLLNGGDHLAPLETSELLASVEGVPDLPVSARLSQSSLAEFFEHAMRDAPHPLPEVHGELRHVGGKLTFLLPATLSTRSYLKQQNNAAEAVLERYAEPLAALYPADNSGDPARPGLSAAASTQELIEHGWDLVLKNAPHDSICGCSVDEVHRENVVRSERAIQVGRHVVERALQGVGCDTRYYGDRDRDSTVVTVLGHQGTPDAATHGPVTVEILTAPDRFVTGLIDPDGQPIAVEAIDRGVEMAFEADLSLLPDSRESRRHRITFYATNVPAFGWQRYTVSLGGAPACAVAAEAVDLGECVVAQADRRIFVEEDASLTVVDGDGTRWSGVARLLDEGDRGDTYNFDPVLGDAVSPVVNSVTRTVSSVRTRVSIQAELRVPEGLSADRNARSESRVTIPLSIEVDAWVDSPQLDVRISGVNSASDHRLRLTLPEAESTGEPQGAVDWIAQEHFSYRRLPLGPELGPLPSEPGLEARVGVAPTHGYAALGAGSAAVAMLPRGLFEVAGLDAASSRSGRGELQVTLLRSTGWLSRFDLRSRTTGAGPMFATPEAQCLGPFEAEVGIVLGDDDGDRNGMAAKADLNTDDRAFALAAAAVRHRIPLLAYQLCTTDENFAPAAARQEAPLRVYGALVSAIKRAENDAENGHPATVIRISNPTAAAREARIWVDDARAYEARLDESLLSETSLTTHDGWVTRTLAPFALETLLIVDERTKE